MHKLLLFNTYNFIFRISDNDSKLKSSDSKKCRKLVITTS